jgi:deazaflavin-dependent oxidoreductase (nitroreductase family)
MSPFFKLFIALHVRTYRATGGKLGGAMGGGKVLLLTTTGNKSGIERTAPVMYFEDGGKNYVVASFGGAPQHPAWYKNLSAKPQVTVQIGPRVFSAKAVTVDEAERVRLFQKVKTEMKQFAGYEKKTQRVIPIVRLDPAS